MSSTRVAVGRALAGIVRQRVVVVLGILGLGLLFVVAPFDRQISELLIRNKWTDFVVFQHHTLFEDGVFGGSDFGLLFQIGCALVAVFGGVVARKLGFFEHGSDRGTASLGSWIRRMKSRLQAAQLEQVRRYCLFVVVSSLYSGLILVQGLKFAWGRARPYVVLDRRPELYSDWYLFGQLSLFDGRYPGSFPSGHVASSAAFFGLAYLWAQRGEAVLQPSLWSRFLVAALCLVSWLAMSLARVMGRDHWPTDCLAAGLLVMVSYAFFAELMLVDCSASGAREKQGWLVSQQTWRHIAVVFGLSFLGLAVLWAARESALAFTVARTPATSVRF